MEIEKVLERKKERKNDLKRAGLSLGWSHIRVAFYEGGLSSGWSLIRVTFYQGGLSSG